MDEQKDNLSMQELIGYPLFCVKENIIVSVNQLAQEFLLSPGMELEPLLLTGAEEYRDFAGDCLFLTLSLGGYSIGASVKRMPKMDVFILEPESNTPEFRALALAARELREPLANVMITAETLLASSSLQDDPQRKEQAAKLNRGFLQMLRLIGNMSDANRYTATSRQELVNISGELEELFEKAQTMVAHTGIHLTYTGLRESVFSMADKEQLERAVLNVLSNALKVTPKGGTIEASLTRKGRMLRLSITDSGSGIAEGIRVNLFHQYLRQPTLGESHSGIGLGMVLVRSAAANHGGAVLIDHPEGKGTRITMTMAIRSNPENLLRSPLIRVDYAGGHDHMLLELSDCLPASLYETEL